jgi:hypothetical protein
MSLLVGFEIPNAIGQRVVPGLSIIENPNEVIPAAVRLEVEGFSPTGNGMLRELGLARAVSGTFISIEGEPTAYVLTAQHVIEALRDGLTPVIEGLPGYPGRPVTDWRVTQWRVVGGQLISMGFQAVEAFEHPGLPDLGIIKVSEQSADSALVARAETPVGTEFVSVGYGMAGPLWAILLDPEGDASAPSYGPHWLPFTDQLLGRNDAPLVNPFVFTATERSLDFDSAIAKFGFGTGRKGHNTISEYEDSPAQGRLLKWDFDMLHPSTVFQFTDPVTAVPIPGAISADPLGDGGPIVDEATTGSHDSGTGVLTDEGATHPTIVGVDVAADPDILGVAICPSLGHPRFRAWIHRVMRVDRLLDAVDGLSADPDEAAELVKNLNKAVAKLDAADSDTLALDEQYKQQSKAVNDLAQVEDILEDIGDDGLRESVAILALEIAEESYKQATLLDPTGEPYIDPPSNPARFASHASRAQVKIADGYENLTSGDYARAISKASGALNDLRNAVK